MSMHTQNNQTVAHTAFKGGVNKVMYGMEYPQIVAMYVVTKYVLIFFTAVKQWTKVM